MTRILRGFVGGALILVGILAVLLFLLFTFWARLPGEDMGQLVRNDAIYLVVAIGSFVGARLALRRPQSCVSHPYAEFH